MDYSYDGPDGPVKLGRWLFAVRGANEAGKVRDDKAKLLDSVDANWAKYDKVGAGLTRGMGPGGMRGRRKGPGGTRGENLNPGGGGKKRGNLRNTMGHGFNTAVAEE